MEKVRTVYTKTIRGVVHEMHIEKGGCAIMSFSTFCNHWDVRNVGSEKYIRKVWKSLK